MTAIYFIYVISFYILWAVLWLYHVKISRFAFARNLWMIAIFAVLHGTSDSIEFFNHLTSKGTELEVIGLVLLIGSFCFLIQFGISSIAVAYKKRLFNLISLVFIIPLAIVIAISIRNINSGDIFTRYLLGFPGSILTCAGLLLQIPEIRKLNYPSLYRYLITASIGFALYGVFAGVIGPEASFPPASILNYRTFNSVIGLPVQLFRAIDVITVTFAMIQVLRAFEIEAENFMKRTSEELEKRIRERTKELQARQTQLQTILESAPAGILVTDASGTFIFSNRLAEEILGGQVTGTAFSLERGYTIHYLDGSSFDPKNLPWPRALRGEPARDEELLIRYQSGEEKMILASARAIMNNSGEISGAVASMQDITERKKAEEELQKQRDQLEEAQKIAKTGSWEWDIVKDKITWSKETYRIFEIEPEGFNATFEAFLGLLDPGDRLTVRERIAQALSENRPYEIDYHITTPNGREKVIHSRGAVIFDPSGKPIFTRGSAQDITHLREKEKEMMKVAKLESLGILAGGIAHDFNNILTSILGNIELAQMALPRESKAAEKIAVAGRACERAKGLSQQLLTFARGGVPIKKLHSLPDIIKEAAELALRGSNVKIDYSFPAVLRPAEVDETQFSQVVNNLVINADQAMPEGGTLEITARDVRLEEGNAQDLEPGKYIRIDFRDQGTGIPRKYFDRIFDPYFTTKEKSSGLGLAVCYSIIKKHGGSLTVDSTPGLGSTFSIFLPASQKEQTAPEAVSKEVEFYGIGRVLVMDDDETVLEIATEMLQHLGYQVETVKDGTEALTAYETALRKGEAFEVSILDLTVPGGMGGKETVQRLLKIDPQAKVIVSSGYANDPIMSDFAGYGFKGVIPKPYKLNELSQTLREVIGNRKE